MGKLTIKERNRRAVIAKCEAVDFEAISAQEYTDFLSGLPPHEFAALLSLHGEFLRSEKYPPEEHPYVAPYTAADPGGTWVDHDGGECPVDGGLVVWVTYPDGDIGGPNLASAFLWGDTIISYAPALNPKLRQSGADHA
jgi:hypothetical protein